MRNVELPHWPTWLWALATVLILLVLYHVMIGARR